MIRRTLQADFVPLENQYGVVILGPRRCGDVQPEGQRNFGANETGTRQSDPEDLQDDGDLAFGRHVHPRRQ